MGFGRRYNSLFVLLFYTVASLGALVNAAPSQMQEMAPCAALIEKYGKSLLQQTILRVRNGYIFFEMDGAVRISAGNRQLKYLTPRSVCADIEAMELSRDEFVALLHKEQAQEQQKSEQRVQVRTPSKDPQQASQDGSKDKAAETNLQALQEKLNQQKQTVTNELQRLGEQQRILQEQQQRLKEEWQAVELAKKQVEAERQAVGGIPAAQPSRSLPSFLSFLSVFGSDSVMDSYLIVSAIGGVGLLVIFMLMALLLRRSRKSRPRPVPKTKAALRRKPPSKRPVAAAPAPPPSAPEVPEPSSVPEPEASAPVLPEVQPAVKPEPGVGEEESSSPPPAEESGTLRITLPPVPQNPDMELTSPASPPEPETPPASQAASVGNGVPGSLRLKSAPEPTPAAPAEVPLGFSSGEASAPPRLLVAEDNVVNQKLVGRLLEKLSYQADIVENGKEVLAALERTTYMAILMDCQMPEMDGFETTAQIRQREHLSGTHTPIIAVTAHTAQDDVDRCLTAGMDDYISKPIKPRVLKEILTRWAPQQVSENNEGAASPSPAFNLSEALEKVDGDAEFLNEMAELFLAEYPSFLSQIQIAIENKDCEVLAYAAHTLKGSAGNFAATETFEAAYALEQMGRQEDLAQAPSALVRLEAALSRLQPALVNLRKLAA